MNNTFLTFIRLMLIVITTLLISMKSSFSQEIIEGVNSYRDGKINLDLSTYKTSEIKNNQTIYFEEVYPSGGVLEKYYRQNDSIFLYMSYYDITGLDRETILKNNGLPQISTKVVEGSIKYDPIFYQEYPKTILPPILKNRGSLQISTKIIEGSTIYDPVTKKEYQDTILIPIGEWYYYYPNENKKELGIYSKNGRNGNWFEYNFFGDLDKIVSCENGLVKSDSLINRILFENLNDSENNIIGTWMVVVDYSNKEKLIKSIYMSRVKNIYGEGVFYTMLEGGGATILDRKILPVEPNGNETSMLLNTRANNVEELAGQWRLSQFNQLEIILEGETRRFKIVYLSDKNIRLIQD